MVSRVLAPMAIEVAVATPSMGVTKVGVLAKTKLPEPVSSEIAVDKAREVVGEQPVQLVTVRAPKVEAPVTFKPPVRVELPFVPGGPCIPWGPSFPWGPAGPVSPAGPLGP